ncbi:hypothetical protein KY289_008358 [Solanum tuberosum]|nr:hypothetical protein KY289_008358 [Solanum tuberosum]
MQLGMVGLCGAIAKQTEKPRDFSTQYVDISINGRLARAMVDSGAEANIMTMTSTTRLGLSYNPSNIRLKTVNTPPTPMCGVSQGVSITLGKWQVKVSKKEGHAHLSAMQIMKGLMKGEPMFIATIASSREDIGAKKPLPPIVEKDLEENKNVMPDELPRTLPPRGERERSKFLVNTDNVATSYFQSQKKITPKEARWQDFLVEFDYVLKYNLGRGNVVADTLSGRLNLLPSLQLIMTFKMQSRMAYNMIPRPRSLWSWPLKASKLLLGRRWPFAYCQSESLRTQVRVYQVANH